MERREQYTLHCRRAVRDDAAPLDQFARQVFTETYAPHNDPEDFERYLDDQFGLEQQHANLSDPGVETWLCVAHGQLAGYVELRVSPVPGCIGDQNALEIRRFYVDRPWHGRQVAPALMRTALDAATKRRASGVWLGVWEHSPRAQAFYRKSGFVKVGQHAFQLGAALQTDLIMYRRLE